MRSVALFLRVRRRRRGLAEALAACAERGVGVAVLKVGSSEAGARAAAAHTGSLAGDQRVFRALVEEAGRGLGEDLHDLLELARGARRAAGAPARRRRARGAHLLGRRLRRRGPTWPTALGLELPPLAAATGARLAELLPDAATTGNPLDYTSLIWGDAPLLARDRRHGRRRPVDRPAAAPATTTPRSADALVGRGPRGPRRGASESKGRR